MNTSIDRSHWFPRGAPFASRASSTNTLHVLPGWCHLRLSFLAALIGLASTLSAADVRV
jgi:hypothetical protein